MKLLFLMIMFILLSCNESNKPYYLSEDYSFFGDFQVNSEIDSNNSNSYLEQYYNYVLKSNEIKILENFIKKQKLTKDFKIIRLIIQGDLIRENCYVPTPEEYDTMPQEKKMNLRPDIYKAYYLNYIYYILINKQNNMRIFYIRNDSIIDKVFFVDEFNYNEFFTINVNEKEIYTKTLNDGYLCFISIFAKNVNRTVIAQGFQTIKRKDPLIYKNNGFLKNFYWLQKFFKEYIFYKPD